MKTFFYGFLIVLFILHQDFWLWDNTNLMLGFLPVGLAYHVVFSIAAAVAWYLAIRFAWPHELLQELDGDDESIEGKKAST